MPLLRMRVRPRQYQRTAIVHWLSVKICAQRAVVTGIEQLRISRTGLSVSRKLFSGCGFRGDLQLPRQRISRRKGGNSPGTDQTDFRNSTVLSPTSTLSIRGLPNLDDFGLRFRNQDALTLLSRPLPPSSNYGSAHSNHFPTRSEDPRLMFNRGDYQAIITRIGTKKSGLPQKAASETPRLAQSPRPPGATREAP